MTEYRPKYATGADDSHYIPRDYLRDRCGGFATAPKEIRGNSMAYTANFRGYRVLLTDTSKYGGVWLDWLLEVQTSGGAVVAKIEMKDPDVYRKDGELKAGALKAGEAWTLANTITPAYILSEESEFETLLLSLIERITA